jgi:hypothetical protein
LDSLDYLLFSLVLRLNFLSFLIPNPELFNELRVIRGKKQSHRRWSLAINRSINAKSSSLPHFSKDDMSRSEALTIGIETGFPVFSKQLSPAAVKPDRRDGSRFPLLHARLCGVAFSTRAAVRKMIASLGGAG